MHEENNLIWFKLDDVHLLVINNINGRWIVRTNEGPLLEKEINYLTAKEPWEIEFKERKPGLIVIKVTDECNLKCRYCYYASDKNKKDKYGTIKEEIIPKISEFLKSLINYFEIDSLTVEFHGGEPLLYPDLIVKIIDAINNDIENKAKISYSAQTNGVIVNSKIIKLIKDHFDNSIGVSIDGPQWIHDMNRVFSNGNPTHKVVETNIKKLLNHDIYVGALAVFTRYSLGYEKEIVEYFYNLGLDSFKVNPVIKQGRAVDIFSEISISGKEFEESYISLLENINRINRSSDKKIYEANFISILQKILGMNLNNTCFLTPCGAGSVIFYIEPNGDLKVCDHLPYILGNITRDPFSKIFRNIMNFQRVFLMKFNFMYNSYCKSCPWFYFCGGGCRGFANDLSKISVFHCDFYNALLKYVFKRLSKNPSIIYEWLPQPYWDKLEIKRII